MEIKFEGIIVIVGNYGSGKTEVAVNLAIHHRQAGLKVRIADLDLVNPYFRSREARQILKIKDIDIVLPPERYLQADLPVLSPAVAGMIRQPSQVTILDAGGDDVGATVLAALADAFDGQAIHMLQVINPMRPFTDTIEGCLQMKAAIEKAARLEVTGLVGNAHLLDDTRSRDILDGHRFTADLARICGLPLEFITASVDLLSSLDSQRLTCPVLPIRRQLVPPWQKAAEI